MESVRIVNETEWSTRDLRAVVVRVFRENRKAEGKFGVPLKVKVVYSRRAGYYSGYAYCNCNVVHMRLPRDGVDVLKVAWLFEHELYHCRGITHAHMGSLNYISHAVPENYPYLAGLIVGRAERHAAVKVPAAVRRAGRVDRAVVLWERRAVLAQRRLRKLKAKQAYYKKKLGSGQ